MKWEVIHIDEADSTNLWLRERASTLRRESAGPVAVWAEYQTAGRGQGSNHWESERGKNLLFSMLIHPDAVPAIRQFHISMAISLAICDALGQYIGGLSVKWPNDIYWRDGKLGGILIEHTVSGGMIRDSIIGVGLNINQQRFSGDAPNPVSVWQICGQPTDRERLLHQILEAFDRCLYADVRPRYLSMLYRRQGYHPYTDREGAFMAELCDVEDDGHLVLTDDGGRRRRYAFKEVQFVV